MIRKILIANRGEIALRIIRTAKIMGIKTVAVFSEADRLARHTLAADEAVYIGESASRDSYLKMDRILQAAKDTHSDAIHPGYGFLSENPAFAKLVESSSIKFIGPPASAMEKMGSKIGAKQTAAKMNVPLVPGTDHAIQSLEEAKTIADQIGFPLLIKASAGGGGKGMRIVHSKDELELQLKSAGNEAMASFGDSSVFIEKYISKPRHIEIQIFTDSFGNGIHLFERECSIQRRHQKIIEEAPSSCLTPELREKMGQDALKLALACGYIGAGTVEFLADEHLNYYFLEMNTRLQVEHTVTEMISGIDLVQLQIEIADGKKLTLNQQDLKINGHSIELRICAEDPLNQFLPSTGILELYQPPSGNAIRLDDAYAQGMEIPLHYDPLIGKLISHGSNRLDAIDKLKSAIDQFKIKGIETTLDFGTYVLNHPEFISGEFDTGFIQKNYDGYLAMHNDPELEEAAALAALKIYFVETNKPKISTGQITDWKTKRKTYN
ncbi:MAG TPA: acetyl-CoA carboxylase biotin carboxylase subunit [Saprospiraceae bacterium]|nr:acetyl-CoA carboxylase biotin carboxylase subunit [Saprospiraceae bacterium]